MIAAAVCPATRSTVGRQVAIALGDEVGELVDLLGRLGRGLDFDPAADALEDRVGIERDWRSSSFVACGHHRHCHLGRVMRSRRRARQLVHPAESTRLLRNRDSFCSKPQTDEIQRLSGPSRAAICSTSSTILRRILASVMRVNARVSARPSEVARKSET